MTRFEALEFMYQSIPSAPMPHSPPPGISRAFDKRVAPHSSMSPGYKEQGVAQSVSAPALVEEVPSSIPGSHILLSTSFLSE